MIATDFRLGSDPWVDRLVRGALAHARARGARKGAGPRGVIDPGEILDEIRVEGVRDRLRDRLFHADAASPSREPAVC